MALLTIVMSIITLIQGAKITISILVPFVEEDELKILQLRRLSLLLLLLLDPELFGLRVGHSVVVIVEAEQELLKLLMISSSWQSSAVLVFWAITLAVRRFGAG